MRLKERKAEIWNFVIQTYVPAAPRVALAARREALRCVKTRLVFYIRKLNMRNV